MSYQRNHHLNAFNCILRVIYAIKWVFVNFVHHLSLQIESVIGLSVRAESSQDDKCASGFVAKYQAVESGRVGACVLEGCRRCLRAGISWTLHQRTWTWRLRGLMLCWINRFASTGVMCLCWWEKNRSSFHANGDHLHDTHECHLCHPPLPQLCIKTTRKGSRQKNNVS